MVKLNKKTGEMITHAENSLNIIGEQLRSAREGKGLSLEAVQKATKIHPETIDAIEKGRLEDKVGEAYVKAFIKNYAAYLGMDAPSMAAEYSSKKHTAEKGGGGGTKKDEPRKREQAPKKKALQKNSNTELIRSVMAILVAIAVIFALILGLIKLGQRAKAAFASIKIKKSAVYKKAEQPAEPAKAIIPIPKQDKLTLGITASTDVWLKVVVDGKVAFYNTLSKKSKETWKAEKEIRLAEIGKPEALKLNVNGKEIDFSDNRLSRSVLITKEGVDFKSK